MNRLMMLALLMSPALVLADEATDRARLEEQMKREAEMKERQKLAAQYAVDPASGKVLADLAAMEKQAAELEARGSHEAAAKVRAQIEELRKRMAVSGPVGPVAPMQDPKVLAKIKELLEKAAELEAAGRREEAAKLRADIQALQAGAGPGVADGSSDLALVVAAPAKVGLGERVKLDVVLRVRPTGPMQMPVRRLEADCLAESGNPRISFEIWHADGKPVQRLVPATQPAGKVSPPAALPPKPDARLAPPPVAPTAQLAEQAWKVVAGEGADYQKAAQKEGVLRGKLIAENYGKQGVMYIRPPVNYFVQTATGKVQLGPPMDDLFGKLAGKTVEAQGKMQANPPGTPGQFFLVGWIREAAASSAAVPPADELTITLKKGEKYVLSDSPFFKPLNEIYSLDRPGKYTFQVRYEFKPDGKTPLAKSFNLISDPVDVEVVGQTALPVPPQPLKAPATWDPVSPRDEMSRPPPAPPVEER